MLVSQQTGTQGGGKIADYVLNLNAQARKLGANDASQGNVPRLEKAITELSKNNCGRLSKLIAHLCNESGTDDCKLLAESAVLFFRILDVCTMETNEARCFYFTSLLDHLFTRRAHLTAFVDICNLFAEQSVKLPVDQLVGVLDTVTTKVKSATETNVNEQWRDCISILVSRLLESTDGGDKTGAQLASPLLGRWLREAANTTVFASIVAIIDKCGASHILRAYIHVDLQKSLDSFESLDDDQKRECSLRTIEVMDKSEDESISDKGTRERLLKALINVWSNPETVVEEGQGDCLPRPDPSSALNQSIIEFHRVIQTHAVIGKLLMNLFKADRARLLSSQFGFAGLISMVATDRHGAAALAELKKCIAQMFKAEGELMATGWVAESMDSVTETLTSQLRSFVHRLVHNLDLWNLLSPPLLKLGYALMETAQGSTPLAISDGRIANGPRVWMLAAKVIKDVVVKKPAGVSVGPSLLQLVESISSATTSNAALVMIDVLLEVVKEHSADVLNNTKVLESISEYASRLRRDVSISLIRSLLPIFHQRIHLREALMLVLKKDLLHDKTVACAVPLLLLLFHSLSRNGGGSNSSQRSQFSQSFATFSSQSLAGMGTSRPRDEKLGMQIIGCLRRCLSQSAPLKAALYMGLAHAVTRDTAATASPCLDLLLGHSSSLPEWKADEIVQSTESLCHLKEALPQFIYALNSVTNTLVASPIDEFASQQAGDSVLEKATAVLNGWAKRAAERELDELALDKISSWNRSTAEGRATILFSLCMKGVYDALIGYLWMRVSALEEQAADELRWLNAILGKKKALQDLMNDTMVKRKEVRAKGDNGEKIKEVPIDEKSCEVPVPMSTLADMLEELVAKEDQRPSLDGFSLLTWAVEKTKAAAISLDKTQNTEVHERTSTASVIAVARCLLILYKGGNECASWLQGMESASNIKTQTIVAYSHLLNWLLSRHTKRIEKIANIWRRANDENTGGMNGELMRHVNLIVSKLLPALIGMVRSVDDQDENGGERDKDKRKAERAELETQTKTLLKIVENLLSMTNTPKSPLATFKLCVKKLLTGDSTAVNNSVLREIFRLMKLAAMRSPHEDGYVDKFLESLGAQVISVLNDEVLEDTLDCVTPLTSVVIVDFLFTTLEDDFDKMRALTNFTAHYASDEQMVSKILGAVAARAGICLKRLTLLMKLHHKEFAKDKQTTLLTVCFTTLDEFFKKLHEVSKPFKIKQWKMLPSAHSLVSYLSRLLAHVDELVGTLIKEGEEENKKKKSKRTYTKTRKEEALFIKFVRAREGVQSRVLILSKALDDKKFNLQVKNNSIGIRDFRLNAAKVTESIKRAAEMDVSITGTQDQPAKKKRKIKSNDEENTRPGSPAV